MVVVLRRGSARRDAHRAEAAGLRSEAETLAATAAGQGAFADQAAQRAEIARVEAEEKAREAARLEAEAAEHRATVEATQREYEATMRRADDIDPDVKESTFPAVAEAEPSDAGVHEGAERADAGADESGDDASAVPMTRAERREAREAGEAHPAPSAASSAPTAGAAGAAAAGASAWAARGEDDHDAGADDEARGDGDQESERIASAAGFRDDVPAEQTEVYPSQDTGSDEGMSDFSRTDTQQSSRDDDGLEADVSSDVESPSGEWGGPPRSESADSAEMTIVEPEHYARTEPVMASEQAAPVAPESVDADASDALHDSDGSHDSNQHAPAEAGAAVAERDDTDRSPADVAEQSTEERYDPTPTRDWAADEGDLLEETHDRGDRLEAERGELAQESGDATDATAPSDGGDPASSDGGDAPASGGRRISAFEEIRDGGFGVGSAAPLDDGAQPLDHPVQGYHDMTFRAPGDAGYDSADPDVWFYDEGAAERSGFRRAGG